MVSKTDRRSRSRVVAKLPVRVRSTAANAELSAQTRDVSTNGVFLYTNSRMAEGSDVELVLILPPRADFRGEVLGVLPCPRLARGAGPRQGIRGRGRDTAHGHTAGDPRLVFARQLCPALCTIYSAVELGAGRWSRRGARAQPNVPSRQARLARLSREFSQICEKLLPIAPTLVQ